MSKRRSASLPPPPGVWEQLAELTVIQQELAKCSTIESKLEVLSKNPISKAFFGASGVNQTLNEVLRQPVFAKNAERMLAAHAVVCCHQGPIVFRIPPSFDKARLTTSMLALIDELVTVERVYSGMGGIVGYHVKVLELIVASQRSGDAEEKFEFLEPIGTDISLPASVNAKLVQEMTYKGIEGMAQMAELYPVGGAGDRLGLKETGTGKSLPAAQLMYQGRTLLEGMIRDLQAKEYLHFRMFGRQLVTPVAMMTSHEKDNNKYIRRICEDNGWFGRPKSSISLFTQPLVPVINKEGRWAMKDPLSLYTKPGGHGMLWKLALEAGVFDMYRSQSRTKVLVRQINNPMAGTDHGILAFTGVGISADSSFGFASCPRAVNAAEGVDVVKYWRGEDTTHRYCCTNVEYTDFKKLGIPDEPSKPGGTFSKFPSNTNILFGDINKIDHLARTTALPGLIVNLKSKAPYIGPDGQQDEIHAGRLESSMQNIADEIVDEFDESIDERELSKLSTFVTYNDRNKTISVTKNQYVPGKSLMETPEGCFYEHLLNCHDLLSKHCQMSLFPLGTREEYISGKGPGFLFYYHPALGPLWSIIGQKIRGGKLAEGAELTLDIAEVDISHLEVKGCLVIKATNPLGELNEDGLLEFGDRCGKATLKNVKVINRGVDYSYSSADNQFWKAAFIRKERFSVTLIGNAEIYAENVTIKGNFDLEVPNNMRAKVYNDRNGSLCVKLEPLLRPSWQWNYVCRSDHGITLERCDNAGAVSRRTSIFSCLCASE